MRGLRSFSLKDRAPAADLRPTEVPSSQVLWIAAATEELLDCERLSLSRIENPLDALRLLRSQDFDVVLASFPLPDCPPPAGLLEEIQQAQPDTPVVIHAPHSTPTEALRLTRLGAFHVFQQGDATSVLYLAANSKWANQPAATNVGAQSEPWRRFLVGESRPMRQVVETLRLITPAAARC